MEAWDLFEYALETKGDREDKWKESFVERDGLERVWKDDLSRGLSGCLEESEMMDVAVGEMMVMGVLIAGRRRWAPSL